MKAFSRGQIREGSARKGREYRKQYHGVQWEKDSAAGRVDVQESQGSLTGQMGAD